MADFPGPGVTVDRIQVGVAGDAGDAGGGGGGAGWEGGLEWCELGVPGET